jgi:hypothetical protein
VGEAAVVVEVEVAEEVVEGVVVGEGPVREDVPDSSALGAPSGGSGSSAQGHGNWTPNGPGRGS